MVNKAYQKYSGCRIFCDTAVSVSLYR